MRNRKTPTKPYYHRNNDQYIYQHFGSNGKMLGDSKHEKRIPEQRKKKNDTY
jgi:hypothetical protein